MKTGVFFHIMSYITLLFGQCTLFRGADISLDMSTAICQLAESSRSSEKHKLSENSPKKSPLE